ncbi:uncharacterized protein LOC114276223 [Camellia sinensis]|uniref:uncharacterized protein LOC114276223 n=1 Tax=Camellia sinensis TaxID=4442 RepID=UPI0010366947|nr:uncharacterized protein LOC114276223 [Camellia sinensis]
MGLLGFSLMLLSMLQIVASQQVTDPNEVEALNKIISHWNLGTKLNISGVDPCTQNATWAPDSANPQIACHCAGTTCHVTRLSVPPSSFSLYFLYTWWCTRFGSI